MGSEAGGPLRAHLFSNCEREGVMLTPFETAKNSNYSIATTFHAMVG